MLHLVSAPYRTNLKQRGQKTSVHQFKPVQMSGGWRIAQKLNLESHFITVIMGLIWDVHCMTCSVKYEAISQTCFQKRILLAS
eukprot:c31031_g1_i1 orf=2-247(-)